MRRWGWLLDTLVEFGDLERQLAWQNHQPGEFIPETLLDRWDTLFLGGTGLLEIGIPPTLIATLGGFDNHLREQVFNIPDSTGLANFISNDPSWQSARAYANVTLARIVSLTEPILIEIDLN